jgi:glycosyltransferase involved in cell wall biosynthesis
LHFTQSLEPLQGGGLGTSVVSLHEQMGRAGFTSVLCSTYAERAQYPIEGIREFRRIRPGFFYYSPELKRHAPELVRQSDVVHGHGLYVGTNLILGGEARRRRKPLVYHVHGMFEPYILGRSRWKKRLVHLLFEDANVRAVRFWRALTPKEADQIRATGARQPIVVLPNGLDPASFEKPADGVTPIDTMFVKALSKDSRRALFLGRVHPKKGLRLLLPVWAKLAALRADWQLVVAGPDEGGHLAQMRALASSLGLGERVVFTGLITGREKTRLLYSADLFILPSYSEGFPMSVLEAWACGLSVVATRECNVGDISAAKAGWECDATPESLETSLRVALGVSDAERSERGANGRRLIEIRYSWPSIARELDQACLRYCRLDDAS